MPEESKGRPGGPLDLKTDSGIPLVCFHVSLVLLAFLLALTRILYLSIPRSILKKITLKLEFSGEGVFGGVERERPRTGNAMKEVWVMRERERERKRNMMREGGQA